MPVSDWRETTQQVFEIIKKCAEEECDGDYKKAFDICYTRFVWS
jgi:hypothetical protein